MNQKLYFFTGKMGVGKTTYAKKLSEKEEAIYLSEDDLLNKHFPNQIKTLQDYVLYANQLKPMVKKQINESFRLGKDVVLDFPGNTIKQRTWFKSLIKENHCNHQLIYLKANDAYCLNHLKRRRESSPERNAYDTKTWFYQVTKYFQEPTEEEGFNITFIDLTAKERNR